MNGHWDVAVAYFEYLARCFPVMCASDEFHFLPRAQAAAAHYDRLDRLGKEQVERAVGRLKRYRSLFDRMAAREADLEAVIDLKLLSASATGALIELDTKKIWRHNPLFYLKIAFIGLDHAMTKPAEVPAESRQRVLSRLDQVPRLLGQGAENLARVNESDHAAMGLMAADCRRYLTGEVARFLSAGQLNSAAAIEPALASLERYRRRVEALVPVPDRESKTGSLQVTLRDHFLSSRGLDDVFDIAADEWAQSLESLKKISRSLSSGEDWRSLYHDYQPGEIEGADTISLYRGEIGRLRRYFGGYGIREPEPRPPLVVAPTPAYLHSVRSSASFAAAFSRAQDEKSYFYITTGFGRGQDGPDRRLARRLHREYKFLSAHETIPGHHLLDGSRRCLKNPVRRQIESPLYYEGWAYYAESLLVEFGYVESPLDRLVDLKRRLWRAARCQIDVGLTSGRIDLAAAIDLLLTAGFSRRSALRQIGRFRLNPGYQVCYSLGRYEIQALKRRFGAAMGVDAFHAAVLEGGQLPFHLIDRRLRARENQFWTETREGEDAS
jgi:hypothetical protein